MRCIILFIIIMICSCGAQKSNYEIINDIMLEVKKQAPDVFSDDGLIVNFEITSFEEKKILGKFSCNEETKECLIKLSEVMFDELSPKKMHLTHVIIHEIGHVMGQKHLEDQSNIMFREVTYESIHEITIPEALNQLQENCSLFKCKKIAW